jgi:hypothetical protein
MHKATSSLFENLHQPQMRLSRDLEPRRPFSFKSQHSLADFSSLQKSARLSKMLLQSSSTKFIALPQSPASPLPTYHFRSMSE